MRKTSRTWLTGAAAVALSVAGIAAGNIAGAQDASSSVPACSAADLTARVTGSGAGMSQLAVYITVTNATTHSCSLNGYPTITSMFTAHGRQQITVKKGAVMNAPAITPKNIVLKPKDHAWFAVGAATAYDPPIVTFIRLRFATTSNSSTATVRHLALQASAPKGKAFPIGVTAFAAGASPAA
ncbi:MAG: DUF4232 domain-containing protein [Candidatus Nanopelagicales bacterium]